MAEFAVESIRRWGTRMGHQLTRRPGVAGDCGRRREQQASLAVVEVRLQKLADEVGLKISACHFPPGTSKWNKIEHRMFCHITENWRGRPPVSHAVVVNLIGSTRTGTGLRIRVELDTTTYETGIKVTNKELETVRLKTDKFHGEWNYTILPHRK